MTAASWTFLGGLLLQLLGLKLVELGVNKRDGNKAALGVMVTIYGALLFAASIFPFPHP